MTFEIRSTAPFTTASSASAGRMSMTSYFLNSTSSGLDGPRGEQEWERPC